MNKEIKRRTVSSISKWICFFSTLKTDSIKERLFNNRLSCISNKYVFISLRRFDRGLFNNITSIVQEEV